MKKRRILPWLAAALAVLAFAVWLARVPLTMALVKQAADRRLSSKLVASLPDGLHVGLCGAGSPVPDEQRGAPCNVIIAGKRMFMIDAGGGAARSVLRMGFNPGELDALFLTHFHSDHIDGIGELLLQRWGGAARTTPLPIYGPDGVADVVDGFMAAYRQDQGYRVAHHGTGVMPPGGFGAVAHSFTAAASDARVVLVDEPDLQIVAFTVLHAPVHPAVGYRIRYKDRTVVFSGDTRKSQAVQREAAKVDLLVHEALSPTLVKVLQDAAAGAGRANLAAVFHDIPDYHSTPHEAAEVARDAGAGMLLLSHIVPAMPLPGMEAIFLGDARAVYHGPLKVGIDGDFISLPAGSRAIIVGKLP
jgi:ribonuclease Z